MTDLPMQRITGLSLSPVEPGYAEWREQNTTHECPICGDVHLPPANDQMTTEPDPAP